MEALGELRPAPLESTTQARLALRQLFGDERLLVYPDGRVEGSARLPVVLREVGAGDPACTRRSIEVRLPLAARTGWEGAVRYAPVPALPRPLLVP